MYYANKIEILKDVFGSNELHLEAERLVVNGQAYPIVDDVIILLDQAQYPISLKRRPRFRDTNVPMQLSDFAEDIQFTFGEEWQRFPKILPEYEQEFLQYFDLVDLGALKNSRVCDLGCGIGRWSYFLRDKCRELVLVDFSEAIFVARKNLNDADNVLFFMGDLKRLPFREDFADFLFCLGVLHHLPTNALEEVRNLKRLAPTILIYLYYMLDNRPMYFRLLLTIVTKIRLLVSKIKSPVFRLVFTWLITCLVYIPFIWLGNLSGAFKLSGHVPLYEGYRGKGLKRIRQDAYDRFFTRVEQRFSKKQITELRDTFSKVIVSDKLPYWHFVCDR